MHFNKKHMKNTYFIYEVANFPLQYFHLSLLSIHK
jgi:hypothetical protein